MHIIGRALKERDVVRRLESEHKRLWRLAHARDEVRVEVVHRAQHLLVFALDKTFHAISLRAIFVKDG